MRPRQKCSICGNEVSPSRVAYAHKQHLAILCDICFKKVRQEKLDSRKAERAEKLKSMFKGRKCVVCGNLIPWKDSYLLKNPETHWPITCCPRCHGIQTKRDTAYTKEQVEQIVMDYIKKQGKYVSYYDIVHSAHIASKTLQKFNISVAELNKRVLGLEEVRVHADCVATRIALSHDEFCNWLKLPLEYDYPTLARSILTYYREYTYEQVKLTLTELICSYIAARKRYTGTVAVMHGLGVSFDSIREHYKIDITALNKELGFSNKRQSWFEDEGYFILCNIFGKDKVSREHVFPDCRSAKHFVLRYDFYIPAYKLLVEVDGVQHRDKDNPYYSESQAQNDEIKEAYAMTHGLILVRVSSDPRKDFTSRFQTKILDVLKPIELLEPLTDNAEGNQQPRPIGQGSETIESKDKQVE